MRKERTYAGLLAAGLLLGTGCTSLNSSQAMLNRGYRDLATGQPESAAATARKMLKADHDSPEALLLKAKACAAMNDRAGALNALETLERNAGNSAAARVSLHEGLLLKARLTGSSATLQKAQQVERQITQGMRARQYKTLISYAEEQGDILQAADLFHAFEQTQDSLLPEDQLHGFVLYYAALRSEDAKRLWAGLTPRQRQMLQARYQTIDF